MIALPSLAALASATARAGAEPRCELCTAPLLGAHCHVVERGKRGVLCACAACAILFAGGDAAARYRTVGSRVRTDATFALTQRAWSELGIPVGLAFCHRDSLRGRSIISYPGPAGIVDAELDETAWDAIEAATPLAAEIEPDIETLLVRGKRGTPAMTCYLVPITCAYELAGRLRDCWRGFSGGDIAERELAAFFASLDKRGGGR